MPTHTDSLTLNSTTCRLSAESNQTHHFRLFNDSFETSHDRARRLLKSIQETTTDAVVDLSFQPTARRNRVSFTRCFHSPHPFRRN
jgi:hypothetical protein